MKENAKPPAPKDCDCGGPVMTPEKNFTDASKSYFVDWTDGHEAPREYSVYGWAKAAKSAAGKSMIFRFTHNEKKNLGD